MKINRHYTEGTLKVNFQGVNLQLRASSLSWDTNSVESHSRIMPSAIYMTVENEIGQKEKLNMSVVSRQTNSE